MKFRLYGDPNCEQCRRALHFLNTEGLPYEPINAEHDPIIAAGIVKHIGAEGRQATLPVLVSFYKNEADGIEPTIVIGWKPKEYERIADSFLRERRQFALNPPVAEGQHLPAVEEAAVPA